MGIGNGKKNAQFPVCGFFPPIYTHRLAPCISHRCGHSGHSLWVSVITLAAAGFPLFWEPLPPRRLFGWQLSSQCLHLLPRWVEPDRPLGGGRGQGKEGAGGQGKARTGGAVGDWEVKS